MKIINAYDDNSFDKFAEHFNMENESTQSVMQYLMNLSIVSFIIICVSVSRFFYKFSISNKKNDIHIYIEYNIFITNFQNLA